MSINESCSEDEVIKYNSIMVIPIMGIRTIKKENSAASFRFIFKNIAVAIVTPDLEIPGIMANACAKPIINA